MIHSRNRIVPGIAFLLLNIGNALAASAGHEMSRATSWRIRYPPRECCAETVSATPRRGNICTRALSRRM